MSLKILLHNLMRSCAHCGSWSANNSFLCQICLRALNSHSFQPQKSIVNGLKVQSCYDWYPDENRILSIVIKNLKGNQHQQYYQFYALYMSLYLKIDLSEPWVVVPCPEKSHQRKHAFHLAAALSRLTNLPLKDCLSYSESEDTEGRISQKDRSRNERKTIKMTTHQSSLSHVIFIDDVITTGSTARAAYLALNSPKEFFVSTLALRRLAASKGFC
jgi:predicted amidophosphoribosyltransferase